MALGLQHETEPIVRLGEAGSELQRVEEVRLGPCKLMPAEECVTQSILS